MPPWHPLIPCDALKRVSAAGRSAGTHLRWGSSTQGHPSLLPSAPEANFGIRDVSVPRGARMEPGCPLQSTESPPSSWISPQPSQTEGLFFTRHFLLIRPLVLVLINKLVLNLIKTYAFWESQKFQSYFILIIPDLIGTSHKHRGKPKQLTLSLAEGVSSC